MNQRIQNILKYSCGYLKVKLTVINKVSAQSDDEGPVHLSVGISKQNIREAAFQHVLAQEWRLLHNLNKSVIKMVTLELIYIFPVVNKFH